MTDRHVEVEYLGCRQAACIVCLYLLLEVVLSAVMRRVRLGVQKVLGSRAVPVIASILTWCNEPESCHY
jgi:hypothetical protein